MPNHPSKVNEEKGPDGEIKPRTRTRMNANAPANQEIIIGIQEKKMVKKTSGTAQNKRMVLFRKGKVMSGIISIPRTVNPEEEKIKSGMTTKEMKKEVSLSRKKIKQRKPKNQALVASFQSSLGVDL